MNKYGFLFLLTLFKVGLYGYISLSDLSLEDAEKVALEYNKPFLISLEDIYQADQRRLQSYSRWFPLITYSSFYTHTFDPAFVTDVDTGTFFSKKDLFINKFELTQPIFSSDLYYQLKTDSLKWESSNEMSNQTKTDILLKVRSYYYLVVQYKISLLVQRENIDYLTDALEMEEGKYKYGDATSLEVNQSKTAVANSISEYYNVLKKLKSARNALIDVLGIDPSSEKCLHIASAEIPIYSLPTINEKLKDIENTYDYSRSRFPTICDFEKYIDIMESSNQLTLFTDEDVCFYLDEAIKNRPDLHVKKYLVNIAEEGVKQNRGKYLPVLTGFVDYTKNGGEPAARVFSQDPFSWAAGIKLSWDLFDSLLRDRQVKEAKSKKISSQLDFEHMVDTIELAVRNDLYQIEEAILAYLSSSSAVLIAKQSMIQAREKLEYGKIPPLDYRDAANQLAKARNLQNSASYQLILAYYQLKYDTGADAKF